jgi:hypothetical protein
MMKQLTPVDPLTADELRHALPDKFKKSLNQKTIDSINQALADPDMYETFRENLLGYANVLEDGKFKMEQYLNAVKYVSYKLANKTNIAAYSLVFPHKIKDFAVRGVEPKDVASYVTSYNKSKLVTLITTQSLIPTWVLNQDNRQLAINTQVEIMLNANSEMAKTAAANSVLVHTAPPESHKVELEISQKPDSSLAALREATMELVAQQKLAIKSGAMSAQDIAHTPVTIDQEILDE